MKTCNDRTTGLSGDAKAPTENRQSISSTPACNLNEPNGYVTAAGRWCIPGRQPIPNESSFFARIERVQALELTARNCPSENGEAIGGFADSYSTEGLEGFL
jgi:hypothetical protein